MSLPSEAVGGCGMIAIFSGFSPEILIGEMTVQVMSIGLYAVDKTIECPHPECLALVALVRNDPLPVRFVGPLAEQGVAFAGKTRCTPAAFFGGLRDCQRRRNDIDAFQKHRRVGTVRTVLVRDFFKPGRIRHRRHGDAINYFSIFICSGPGDSSYFRFYLC